MSNANMSVQGSERERETGWGGGGVERERERTVDRRTGTVTASDSSRSPIKYLFSSSPGFHPARVQDHGQMFFVFVCVSEKVWKLVTYCTGALFDRVYILN